MKSRKSPARDLAPPASPQAPALLETQPIVETPDPGLSTREQEIARLAFGYWMERGCKGGSAEQDWLRAEAEWQNQVDAAARAGTMQNRRANRATAGG
jgi:hypothetical protein